MFSEDIQDKLITLGNLQKLDGAPHKPILIDNEALHALLREVLLECGRIEEISKNKHHYMLQFNHLLEMYKQVYPEDFGTKRENLRNTMYGTQGQENG